MKPITLDMFDSAPAGEDFTLAGQSLTDHAPLLAARLDAQAAAADLDTRQTRFTQPATAPVAADLTTAQLRDSLRRYGWTPDEIDTLKNWTELAATVEQLDAGRPLDPRQTRFPEVTEAEPEPTPELTEPEPMPATMRVHEITLHYRLVQPGAAVRLDTPSKIADYVREAYDRLPHQEQFYCVYLDNRGHPIGRHLITIGTVNSTVITAREVFRGAILAGAASVVISHNHPSGDPTPSQADLRVTRTIRNAGEHIEIRVQDHVVMGRPECDPTGKGWYSFMEAGLM